MSGRPSAASTEVHCCELGGRRKRLECRTAAELGRTRPTSLPPNPRRRLVERANGLPMRLTCRRPSRWRGRREATPPSNETASDSPGSDYRRVACVTVTVWSPEPDMQLRGPGSSQLGGEYVHPDATHSHCLLCLARHWTKPSSVSVRVQNGSVVRCGPFLGETPTVRRRDVRSRSSEGARTAPVRRTKDGDERCRTELHPRHEWVPQVSVNVTRRHLPRHLDHSSPSVTLNTAGTSGPASRIVSAWHRPHSGAKAVRTSAD
jgi:hypothetical protein